MSAGQGVLWNFKVKMKPTVPLGQLPYQGATGNFWLKLGKINSMGSITSDQPFVSTIKCAGKILHV
jgi:hypothetical protein